MNKKKGVIITLVIGLVVGIPLGFALTGLEKEPPKPMTQDCMIAGCHDIASDEAAIHVAVNQKELTDGESVTVASGTSMELDFYFKNMAGKHKRLPVIGVFISPHNYRNVGIELAVNPDWDVSLGTTDAPQGWNPVWQRGNSGPGELTVTSWQPVEGVSGRYYLDFGTSPWRTSADLPALAADDGNEGTADQDATTGKMGSDVIVRLPQNISPGHYQITIAGVGHDSKGRKVYIAQTIDVEVEEISFVSTTDENVDGELFYKNLCSSCHSDTPSEKGKLLRRGTQRISWVINWGTGSMRPIRGLTEGEVAALLSYIQEGAGPIPSAIPYVPHVVEGQICQSCHSQIGIRPAPTNHKSYTQNQCMFCHKVLESVLTAGIPQVPHPTEGRTCLKCHTADGLVPVRPSHQGRTEDVCLACHVVAKDMVGVIFPSVPHPIREDTACSSCHGFDGSRPIPQDHQGRQDKLCSACHEADSGVIASIPLMNHSPEGREACLACHSPAGWLPAPADHWDKTQDTCLLCH